MTDIKRKTIEVAPTPANWKEVRVGELIVYRESRDELTGHKVVETPFLNDAGEPLYEDGEGGNGRFAEGAQPEGWTLRTIKTNTPVYAPARGMLRGVDIVEEDANGAVINRGTEGYASFGKFNTAELRELAIANPSTVGAKYQETIVALQELADAIYTAVK